MNLNNLTPAAGSVKSSKRIGRGPGSKSRFGYSRKIGFEGGQMPLQRRLPKFGFKSMNRVEYKPINLSTLQELADKLGIDTINFDTLVNAGFLSKNSKVKILANGELKSKLLVEAHAFSNTAKAAIEALGGEAKTL